MAAAVLLAILLQPKADWAAGPTTAAFPTKGLTFQRKEAEAAETAGIPQEARCLAGAAALEPGETPALPEGHGMAETGATRLKVCRFTTGAECLAGTAGRGMGL